MATDFDDFNTKYHARTWDGFTKFVVRSTVAVIVSLVLIGWITGVL